MNQSIKKNLRFSISVSNMVKVDRIHTNRSSLGSLKGIKNVKKPGDFKKKNPEYHCFKIK